MVTPTCHRRKEGALHIKEGGEKPEKERKSDFMNSRIKNFLVTPMIMLFMAACVGYSIVAFSKKDETTLFCKLLGATATNKACAVIFLIITIAAVLWNSFSMRSYVPIMVTGIVAGGTYLMTGSMLATVGFGLAVFLASMSYGKGYVLCFIASAGTALQIAIACVATTQAFHKGPEEYTQPGWIVPLMCIGFIIICVLGIKISHDVEGECLIFGRYFSEVKPSGRVPLSEAEGKYRLILAIVSTVILAICIYVYREPITLGMHAFISIAVEVSIEIVRAVVMIGGFCIFISCFGSTVYVYRDGYYYYYY